MNKLPENLKKPLINLLLAVADDKLMLGHRNSDWTGLAPILEEDIAFSSLSQDEIAHAQTLYNLAGTLNGKSADETAFGRSADEYRCATIVELPDDYNWAVAIARRFFCDHFDLLRLKRLSQSSYKPLADLAKRLHAEEKVHVEHVDAWMVRLGRGNDDSKQRLQDALDTIGPYAPMLFEQIDGEARLVEAGIYPQLENDAYEIWRDTLQQIIQQSGLNLALDAPDADAKGGRNGQHSEHFTALLDEMCEVYRLEPGAAW